MTAPASEKGFVTEVATFDRKDDGWAFAREIAALLVRTGLAPTYGVRTVKRIKPNRAAWYAVEVVGPAPLSTKFKGEIARRLNRGA